MRKMFTNILAHTLIGMLPMLAATCGNTREVGANQTQSLQPNDTIPQKTNGASDTAIFNPDRQNDDPVYGGYRKTPKCIREMIVRFSTEPVTNPPRKIYQYHYKGNIVFYVPALCCDFYSDLYDMDCNLIGHPDGGYTGRGDGSFPDFTERRKDEKLIWADKRKN